MSPYGVYDLAANEAWVSVGTDHDTAAFAVESIRRWWRTMGEPLYPDATRLLVTADSGGSNGYRLRLWKLELQRLADETGPGDRGLPLPAGHEQVEQGRAPAVQRHHPELAGQAARLPRDHRRTSSPRPRPGRAFEVRSALDTSDYPAGLSVSDAEMATLHLQRDDFHGEWNYTLLPRQRLP